MSGDESAFPQENGNPVGMNGTIRGPGKITGGLTKREYFAGLAMQGLKLPHWGDYSTGDHERGTPSTHAKKTAEFAVLLADALIKELEKPRE